MNTTMRYTEQGNAPPQRFYTPDEDAGRGWQYGAAPTDPTGGTGSASTVGMVEPAWMARSTGVTDSTGRAQSTWMTCPTGLTGSVGVTGPTVVGGEGRRSLRALPDSKLNNVVAVESAVSGVGVSTLSALLARNLAQSGIACALIDADLQGGGLDVLLGIENEDGTRFGDINTPLGNVNGKALLREMPQWDGVPVLSCDPWKAGNPQSWDVRACIRALSQVRDAVVVDASQRIGLQEVAELNQCARIVVVELTVLGLARAKTMLCASAQSHSKIGGSANRMLLVGAEPRGTLRKRGITEVREAENYLECNIAAVIQPDPHLCSEQLEGLGLRNPNKSTAKAIRTCTDFVLEQLENKRGKHGTRSP